MRTETEAIFVQETSLGSYEYVCNEALASKQKVMKRDCPRNTRKLHL